MQRLVLVPLAAVAVFATAPTAVLGQGGGPQSASGPLKIAFISSQEILRATPGYAVAESTYRREFQASQVEVQKLQHQLDSAGQGFDQQSIALSPAARQAKQKDLQTMQQHMEQRSSELQDHLQQREQELLGPLRARISADSRCRRRRRIRRRGRSGAEHHAPGAAAPLAGAVTGRTRSSPDEFGGNAAALRE